MKLILNESETANQFLQIANSKFKLKEQLEQLQVLRGINALLQGKSNEAMKYFKGIQSPWLNKIIEQNSSPSKLIHKENSCMPDIILPQSKDKGTLLQEKKINMDTISMNWNREQITITTPSKNKVFNVVQIISPINCIPIKVFDQRGVRWNNSLISIKNPLDDKLVFYSVR